METLVTYSTREIMLSLGFDGLTGERCGYGMRTLYDVSPSGIDFLKCFFNVENLEPEESWNHGSTNGWGSIMLPHLLSRDIITYNYLCGGENRAVVVIGRAKDINRRSFNIGTILGGSIEEYEEAKNSYLLKENEYNVYFSAESEENKLQRVDVKPNVLTELYKAGFNWRDNKDLIRGLEFEFDLRPSASSFLRRLMCVNKVTTKRITLTPRLMIAGAVMFALEKDSRMCALVFNDGNVEHYDQEVFRNLLDSGEDLGEYIIYRGTSNTNRHEMSGRI